MLTQYDGKGKCDCIQLGGPRWWAVVVGRGGGPKKNQYKNQMFEWALKVGWHQTRSLSTNDVYNGVEIELKRPNAESD